MSYTDGEVFFFDPVRVVTTAILHQPDNPTHYRDRALLSAERRVGVRPRRYEYGGGSRARQPRLYLPARSVGINREFDVLLSRPMSYATMGTNTIVKSVIPATPAIVRPWPEDLQSPSAGVVSLHCRSCRTTRSTVSLGTDATSLAISPMMALADADCRSNHQVASVRDASAAMIASIFRSSVARLRARTLRLERSKSSAILEINSPLTKDAQLSWASGPVNSGKLPSAYIRERPPPNERHRLHASSAICITESREGIMGTGVLISSTWPQGHCTTCFSILPPSLRFCPDCILPRAFN